MIKCMSGMHRQHLLSGSGLAQHQQGRACRRAHYSITAAGTHATHPTWMDIWGRSSLLVVGAGVAAAEASRGEPR